MPALPNALHPPIAERSMMQRHVFCHAMLGAGEKEHAVHG